ncbi:MAG: hypothetical protein Q9188_003521 [Gyalolechia gomerana]
MNNLFRTFLYHAAVVEVNTPIQSTPAVREDRVDLMRPGPAEKYSGIALDAAIEPCTVKGTWYPSTYEAGDENNHNIILYFHGGGYAMCGGSEGDSGFAASLLVKHAAAKALFPSNRLSSNQGGGFPAALQDAVTAYNHLLDLGIPPGKIVLSGDSAGGNLTIAQLRYMGETSRLFPQPLSVLSWSPTTGMLAAKEPLEIDQNRNSSTDFLAGDFCAWGAKGLITNVSPAATPYFSLRKNPFSCQVPMWIQVGGLEVLYYNALEFAGNMRKQGNAVEVYVEPYANHDILYLGGSTGFGVEAVKAVKEAREFLGDLKRD